MNLNRMGHLFKNEFKSCVGSMIKFSMTMSAIMSLYVIVYPYMAKDIDLFMNSMSQALIEALSIGSLQSYMGYFSFFASLVLGIGFSIQGVLYGVKTLSKEKVNQTMFFLLTKPISRKDVLIAKVLANILALKGTILLNALWMMMLSFLITPEHSLILFAKIYLMILLQTLFMFALGLFISSLFKQINEFVTISLTIVMALYAIQISVSLLDKAFLLWLSPFNYFQIQKIVTDAIAYPIVVFGIVVMILLFIGSYFKYKTEDF